MVKAELLLGAEKSQNKAANMEKIRGFLGMVEVVPFCARSAEEYAVIRAGLEKNGRVVGSNDMVIAATVIANNGTLVTNNTREFSPIPGLRLEVNRSIEGKSDTIDTLRFCCRSDLGWTLKARS